MPAIPRLRPWLLLLAAALAGCTPAAEGVVAIGAVQGRGDASPLLGRTVTVEGVVTGDFARHLDGWFVQDAGDGDPATSDGLFVVSDLQPDLRAGDRVRLHGRVVEHGERGRGTLTTLQASAIDVVGRGDVAPVVLTAPPTDWERYEGMRVVVHEHWVSIVHRPVKLPMSDPGFAAPSLDRLLTRGNDSARYTDFRNDRESKETARWHIPFPHFPTPRTLWPR